MFFNDAHYFPWAGFSSAADLLGCDPVQCGTDAVTDLFERSLRASPCDAPCIELEGMSCGGDGAENPDDAGRAGGAVGERYSNGKLPCIGGLGASAELAIDHDVVLFKARGEFVSFRGDASRIAGEGKDPGTSSWRCRPPGGLEAISRVQC